MISLNLDVMTPALTYLGSDLPVYANIDYLKGHLRTTIIQLSLLLPVKNYFVHQQDAFSTADRASLEAIPFPIFPDFSPSTASLASRQLTKLPTASISRLPIPRTVQIILSSSTAATMRFECIVVALAGLSRLSAAPLHSKNACIVCSLDVAVCLLVGNLCRYWHNLYWARLKLSARASSLPVTIAD